MIYVSWMIYYRFVFAPLLRYFWLFAVNNDRRPTSGNRRWINANVATATSAINANDSTLKVRSKLSKTLTDISCGNHGFATIGEIPFLLCYFSYYSYSYPPSSPSSLCTRRTHPCGLSLFYFIFRWIDVRQFPRTIRYVILLHLAYSFADSLIPSRFGTEK